MKDKENKMTGLELFLYGLTLIFIHCKLAGHINWSWFWVLSPLLFQIIFLIIIFIVVGFMTMLENMKMKKKIDKVDFDETLFGEN